MKIYLVIDYEDREEVHNCKMEYENEGLECDYYEDCVADGWKCSDCCCNRCRKNPNYDE